MEEPLCVYIYTRVVNASVRYFQRAYVHGRLIAVVEPVQHPDQLRQQKTAGEQHGRQPQKLVEQGWARGKDNT